MVEVTKLLSKILKFKDILIRYDDKYVIDKGNALVDHSANPYEENKSTNEAFDLDIIYAQANNIIANSKDKAKDIIIDAEKRAQSIKEEAYEAGYLDGQAKGYEQGYHKATKKVDKTLSLELKKIEEMRLAMYEERASILRQSERDLIELALAIAEKIINIELQNDDAYIKLIEKVVKSVKGRKTIQLHVSSEDFDRVSNNIEYLISSVEGLEDIDVVEDRYLTKNSCIVDGGIGVIDGSVDTQLKQIEEAFRSVLNWEEN